MDAKRVVIIDDEMVLGQLLQAAFATLSGRIDVTVVPSAEDARREMLRTPVQLVVSDVKLPGISGLELTTQIRQKDPDVKIILVSGMNDPHLQEKALAAGADAFYPKPVEMRDFLETSSRMLGLMSTQPLRTNQPEVVLEKNMLVDILIGLRQDLGALAVTLVDARGKILASAGDPPEGVLANKIIPDLISAGGFMQRLNSSMLAVTPENVITIRGGQYDLLASMMSDYLLIVFLKHTQSGVRMAIAYDSLMEAMADLVKKVGELESDAPTETHQAVEKMLAKTGPLQLPEALADVIPVVEETEPDTSDFDDLFKSVSKKKLKTDEVESFWESATAKASISEAREAGLLSFDEANQLGLTPKEGE